MEKATADLMHLPDFEDFESSKCRFRIRPVFALALPTIVVAAMLGWWMAAGVFRIAQTLLIGSRLIDLVKCPGKSALYRSVAV